YPADAEGPRQVVIGAEVATPDLEVTDTDDGAALRVRITELTGVGFDITEQPPLRLGLFRLTGTAEPVHVLVLVVHHISADGFSMTPLATDLMAAYARHRSVPVGGAAASAGEFEQAPLPVQYADFALWQRELLGDESDPESMAAQQIRYWTDTLAGAPDVLDLPADRPRPAVQSMRSADVDLTIDAALHRRLTELAAAQDASLFM
ncbi:condensation domain-containing protein, partial [Nocardia farcinica]